MTSSSPYRRLESENHSGIQLELRTTVRYRTELFFRNRKQYLYTIIPQCRSVFMVIHCYLNSDLVTEKRLLTWGGGGGHVVCTIVNSNYLYRAPVTDFQHFLGWGAVLKNYMYLSISNAYHVFNCNHGDMGQVQSV